MGHGFVQAAAFSAAFLGLSGCLQDAGGTSFVSRLKSPDTIFGKDAQDAETEATPAAFAGTSTEYDNTLNAESVVIGSLVSRRSVIPTDSAYDQVIASVLAANARSSESELRAARLRAESASKNWLPTIGPSVSLSSLSDVIVNLVVDQVIFDNGRKKGERAFAKADVEVAAVVLAEDTNDRAATGLTLFLDAAEGREKAALNELTLKNMSHFEYIMSERVRGGVSDMSDLNVIRQKVSEIRAALAANEETVRSAIAELNAMSVHPLGDVRGLSPIDVSTQSAQALSVTRAEATMTRDIAEAKVERAGVLPGINARATIGEGGGIGVNTDGTQLGLGTKARLKAIEHATETATRQVAQANEDANRSLRRLESQIAATSRQAGETAGLTAQAKNNLDLFQAQYQAGQRQVIDVVSVYETFARSEEAEVTLKYEAIRLKVEMARILGVLADGDLI